MKPPMAGRAGGDSLAVSPDGVFVYTASLLIASTPKDVQATKTSGPTAVQPPVATSRARDAGPARAAGACYCRKWHTPSSGPPQQCFGSGSRSIWLKTSRTASRMTDS